MDKHAIEKKLEWLDLLRRQQQERLAAARAEAEAAVISLHKIDGAKEVLTDMLLLEFPPEKEALDPVAEYLANGLPAAAAAEEN